MAPGSRPVKQKKHKRADEFRMLLRPALNALSRQFQTKIWERKRLWGFHTGWKPRNWTHVCVNERNMRTIVIRQNTDVRSTLWRKFTDDFQGRYRALGNGNMGERNNIVWRGCVKKRGVDRKK